MDPMPTDAMAVSHRLGHVALRVQDMERAKRFYLDLGLRLTWEAE
ncbi:VOC family protein, partial [Vulcanococcus sp. DEBay_Sum29NL08_54]